MITYHLNSAGSDSLKFFRVINRVSIWPIAVMFDQISECPVDEIVPYNYYLHKQWLFL